MYVSYHLRTYVCMSACTAFEQFLLERIHPTMIITGAKMEEEVPRTLGYLGYPFTVAKSCLKSVGSPHAWPILVGVLTWLIEVCTYVCTCSVSAFERP